MQEKRIYNLKRERVQRSDEPKKFLSSQLPSSIDLRYKLPPVYNQGSLGSCTAQAGAAAYSFISKKPPNPSRLFLYYNERMLDGDISVDAGSSLSQCINALEQFGVCGEKLWSYDISKFAIKPPQQCYDNAKKNVATEVNRVTQTQYDMKSCLASGFVFIFGIAVYPSFESNSATATGIIPMPSNNEVSIGNHAIVAVGYDDSKQVFIFRNSWGEDWGEKGYGYLPYAYMTDDNLASDLWVIKKTSR